MKHLQSAEENLKTAVDLNECLTRRLELLQSGFPYLKKEIEEVQKGREAGQRNLKEAWESLAMIRETVETLGPVGAIASGEHTACTPGEKGHFIREAEELVKGIRKIAGVTNEKTTDREKPCANRREHNGLYFSCINKPGWKSIDDSDCSNCPDYILTEKV